MCSHRLGSPVSSRAVEQQSISTEVPHGYCRACAFSGRQLHCQGQDLHKVSFWRGLFQKRTRFLPTVDDAGPHQLFFKVMLMT